MSLIISNVAGLRAVAAGFSSTRRVERIQLARGVYDLGNEGVMFGGTDQNDNTLWGLNIAGEGSGFTNGNGSMAPTSIRYSGTGAAIDLRGVNCGSLSNLAVWAPNGTGVRLAASTQNLAWGGKFELDRLWITSDLGVDLMGMDSAPGRHANGQLDLVKLTLCILQDCRVGFRQNSLNTIGTSLDTCHIGFAQRGVEALEGTIKLRNCSLGDTPDSTVSSVAFYAHRAEDIAVDDGHFECDRAQLVRVEALDFAGAFPQARFAGNRMAYGITNGLGFDYRRQGGSLILIGNLYGLRQGAMNWRIRVPRQTTLTEIGPRLQQITLERV